MPPQRISDHTPCLISLACPPPYTGSKPFKFYNFLSSHPDFLSTITNAWICTEIEDYSLNKLSFKQKDLRRALKTLDTENFSEIQKRVCEANSLLNDGQVQSLNEQTTAHFQDEKQCMEKLLMLRKIEEAFSKQKSRINWLKLGDQNTNYFHKMMKARHAYNVIHTLLGTDGFIASTPADISNLALNHFTSILGSHVPPGSPNQRMQILSSTTYTCSQ